MKKIQLNAAAALAIVVGVGATCMASGAVIGYIQGYKQGDFDGRHEVARSSLNGVTELMTRGVKIKQADGASKTYVLQPVEVTKN